MSGLEYTANYTGQREREPVGSLCYWWVMQGLNLRPLPCEGKSMIIGARRSEGKAGYGWAGIGRKWLEISPRLHRRRVLRLSRRTGFIQCHTVRIIPMVNGADTPDNRARASILMRFTPLRRARCVGTGNAADWRLFAFSGRCFEAVKRDEYPAPRSTPADDGVWGQVARGKRASAIPVRARLAGTPAAASKHRQSSGRALTQQTGQCRGRTHVPMPHMTPAARPCAGTAANRQANRPCDWPTNGRLEVRMHRL